MAAYSQATSRRRVRGVCFDNGNVLTLDVWERMLPDVLGPLGLDPERILEIGAHAWHAFDLRPALDQAHADDLEHEYWELIAGQRPDGLAGSIDIDACIRDTDRYIVAVPGMLAMLQRLAEHDIPLCVLSNATEFFYRRIARQCGLDRFFATRRTILSCREQRRKPDPMLYERVVAALGLEPSEIVYVDDRSKNLEPARNLGMVPYLFPTDEPTAASDLADLLRDLGLPL